MISSLRAKNLRGLASATIEGLSRLVVVVGPNGSGKSTLLEAILLGAADRMGAALGFCVKRRAATLNGARWLIHGGASSTVAEVSVSTDADPPRTRRIHWDEKLFHGGLTNQLVAASSPAPYSALRAYELPDEQNAIAIVGVGADNMYAYVGPDEAPRYRVWFIEPRVGEPLHDVYSRVKRTGRWAAVESILERVVPGRSMEILTEDGQPRLCFVNDATAVPVTLAGDGVYVLSRMALELSAAEGGTVLLEEPEVHAHPAVIQQMAIAIVAAMRTKIQVVLTSHSLELIRALLAQLTTEELRDPNLLSVVRTRLRDGVLVTNRIEAETAETRLNEVEEDLR